MKKVLFLCIIVVMIWAFIIYKIIKTEKIEIIEGAEKTKIIEKIKWVESKNLTVGWSTPASLEDGTPISKKIELRYKIFIERRKDASDKSVELLTKIPIAENQYTINSIKHEGKYCIGVQAIVHKDEDISKKETIFPSRIAWSCNQSDTESGGFGVVIK